MEKITNYNCEGMCCEQNCSKKYTHHTTIEKNGMKMHLCFCKKHADIYEAFKFNDNKQEDIYIINCEEDGNQLKFFCEFCGKWHFHGEGEGHRHAHCSNPNSPYQKTGYYLKLKEKKQ